MMFELVSAGNDSCACVSKHVPLPQRLIKVKDILLCPTAYDNLLCLWIEYDKFNGEPPGYVRKHYSDYIQKLAKELR